MAMPSAVTSSIPERSVAADAENSYWRWRRRSLRLQFFISGLVSWSLHGCILLLLLWGGKSLATKTAEPPRVDVVAAAGPPVGAAGRGVDGISPGIPTGTSDNSAQGSAKLSGELQFLPDALPTSVARALPKSDFELPDPSVIGSIVSGALPNSGAGDDRAARGNNGRGGGGGTGLIGLGPGWANTEFGGVQASGSKFVYVLDRSGSMTHYDRLGAVKRDLLASLANLSAESEFQVFFYNTQADAVLQPKFPKLHKATDQNKLLVAREIDKLVAEGGTEHLPALQKALALRPDVIFFLTDADDLQPHHLKEVSELNKGRTTIHTIEFSKGPPVDRENMLRKLAEQNGGSYRYVDVSKLAAPN